jgi:hypothetical protein
MAADELTGSGDTAQRLTRATQLATILSAIVVTAGSITAMASTSVSQLSLFVSLVVAIGLGLHLLTEESE